MSRRPLVKDGPLAADVFADLEVGLSRGRVQLVDKDVPVGLDELLEVAEPAVLDNHVEVSLGAQVSGARTFTQALFLCPLFFVQKRTMLS